MKNNLILFSNEHWYHCQWCNNVVKGPWRKQIKGPYFSDFLVSAWGRGLVSSITVVITVDITVLEGEGDDECAKKYVKFASIILHRNFIILA